MIVTFPDIQLQYDTLLLVLLMHRHLPLLMQGDDPIGFPGDITHRVFPTLSPFSTSLAVGNHQMGQGAASYHPS